MVIPVARVHLAVEHAALPALLPTPPKSKMLPLLPTSCVCVAAIPSLPMPPSRADSDEPWDAHKAKPRPPCIASSASPWRRRSPLPATVSSSAARASSSDVSDPRKNATSPPPKPGRADSVERWDAHKNATSPPLKPGRADSVERWDAHKKAAPAIPGTSSSSSGTSSCTERWDVHKKRCLPQAVLLDDGESNRTGSNDDIDMEEEILWKPRAMYAGLGFVAATPEPSMLPVPTAFLCRVA
jgi:hypothetical protein